MPGFNNIIGHDNLKKHLINAVRSQKVSHAYIFSGPDRSGKMMLAEAFSMALQCEHQTGEPCGICRSCKQAAGKNNPDIIYVTHDKPNTISVDDIREKINNDIVLKPYSSRRKVYIVDEAEKMNVQAQNALLKTIEEPPEYGVIILLTNNADMFLPTILSRCVKLELKAVEDELIKKHLMKEYMVPDYQADVYTAFAQGNVGRAVMLLSSEKFNDVKKSVTELVTKIQYLNEYDIPSEVKKIEEIKDNIGDFFDLLLFWFRDVLIYKACYGQKPLVFAEQKRHLTKMSDHLGYADISNAIEAIETARRRLSHNVNFEMAITELLMNLSGSCMERNLSDYD